MPLQIGVCGRFLIGPCRHSSQLKCLGHFELQPDPLEWKSAGGAPRPGSPGLVLRAPAKDDAVGPLGAIPMHPDVRVLKEGDRQYLDGLIGAAIDNAERESVEWNTLYVWFNEDPVA
jgi:hypothetical protein